MQNHETSLKNKARRAEGMAQVVEHMPSKHKAMISTPVLPKRKNKTTKQNKTPQLLLKLTLGLIGIA
jgi:hypothetical protein